MELTQQEANMNENTQGIELQASQENSEEGSESDKSNTGGDFEML